MILIQDAFVTRFGVVEAFPEPRVLFAFREAIQFQGKRDPLTTLYGPDTWERK